MVTLIINMMYCINNKGVLIIHVVYVYLCGCVFIVCMHIVNVSSCNSDVAELILNKCTEPDWSSGGKPSVQPHPDRYTVTFNFELLEDLDK